jgi:hypothetical protein
VKRLPEEFDTSNRDETYLAGLLRHVQPFEPSAEQMERVWTSLERSPSRRPRRRASGPVIAGLLLCGATVASATMPHVWKRIQPALTEAAPVSPATIEKAAPRRTPPAAPPVPTAPLEPFSDSIALAEAAPPSAPAVRKATSSKPRVAVAERVDSLASGALMVEAIRERRAGHIARARELASEYRAQYPGGALFEEALALSMETAAALGDDEAPQLARLYLQQYPHGRFRAQAQRVVDKAR